MLTKNKCQNNNWKAYLLFGSWISLLTNFLWKVLTENVPYSLLQQMAHSLIFSNLMQWHWYISKCGFSVQPIYGSHQFTTITKKKKAWAADVHLPTTDALIRLQHYKVITSLAFIHTNQKIRLYQLNDIC